MITNRGVHLVQQLIRMDGEDGCGEGGSERRVQSTWTRREVQGDVDSMVDATRGDVDSMQRCGARHAAFHRWWAQVNKKTHTDTRMSHVMQTRTDTCAHIPLQPTRGEYMTAGVCRSGTGTGNSNARQRRGASTRAKVQMQVCACVVIRYWWRARV